MSDAAPSSTPPPSAARGAPASPWELFRVFSRLALQGFGGVLPVAQYHLVERERWMTAEEFVECLSIGQVLPGPNVCNVALMVGDRYFGLRGALAALAGILLLPLAIVVALAALYAQLATLPWVVDMLRGMGAVAAGLVIGTAVKLARTLPRQRLGWKLGAAIAVLVFVAVGIARWPMLGVVFGLGTASVAVAAWRLRAR